MTAPGGSPTINVDTTSGTYQQKLAAGWTVGGGQTQDSPTTATQRTIQPTAPAAPTGSTGAVTYTKNGVPINPALYTNLTPGTTAFNDYLREQGIVAVQPSGGSTTTPTGTTAPTAPTPPQYSVQPVTAPTPTRFDSNVDMVGFYNKDLGLVLQGNAGNAGTIGQYGFTQISRDQYNQMVTSGQAKEYVGNLDATRSMQPYVPTADSDINAQYQKYFGRNATTSEISYWRTQPTTALDQQLQTDYRNASGIAYDGSPIASGQTRTANQIASGTPTAPTNGQQSTANDPVNSLYQKYFGRNAYPNEVQFWSTQPSSALEAQLQSDYQQASGHAYDGSPINPGNTTSSNFLELPEELRNSAEYLALTPDMRAMVQLTWASMSARDEQIRQNAQEALTAAQGIVDPYTRVMMGFALDSIPDEFRVQKTTIEDNLKTAQERLNEIGSLMQDATLEEQQTLKAMAREYETKIESTQEQMADAGLTYSTKRTDLEKYIADQNIDMVSSTQRSYATQMRNYEQNQAQMKRQQDLIRQAGEAQLKQLARTAEEQLGTAGYRNLGLTGLSGQSISSVGGNNGVPEYGGSIEQQRQQMILGLATQIQQYGDPSSITSLLSGNL